MLISDEYHQIFLYSSNPWHLILSILAAELTRPKIPAIWCQKKFCLDKRRIKDYGRTMIVYDGVYRLPAGANQGFKPRSQWEYAWQVRIINLNLSPSTVAHLKSNIVVIKQTGSKLCLTSCAESIGKRISRDLNLVIPRVLWVEHFPNQLNPWRAAVFKPKTSFGPDIDYHIRWRPLRPEEIDIIAPFILEVGNLR